MYCPAHFGASSGNYLKCLPTYLFRDRTPSSDTTSLRPNPSAFLIKSYPFVVYLKPLLSDFQPIHSCNKGWPLILKLQLCILLNKDFPIVVSKLRMDPRVVFVATLTSGIRMVLCLSLSLNLSRKNFLRQVRIHKCNHPHTMDPSTLCQEVYTVLFPPLVLFIGLARLLKACEAVLGLSGDLLS